MSSKTRGILFYAAGICFLIPSYFSFTDNMPIRGFCYMALGSIFIGLGTLYIRNKG